MSFNLSRRAITLAAVAAAFVTVGCGRSAASRSDSASGESSPAADADTMPTVRGTVVSVSPTNLVIKADTGSVTVKVTQPLQLYDREPAQLADVKDNSFIGVTTVKQPDGSERATEIHIFPEALRGLGEGSRMMTQSAAGSSNRMTNGAVSGSRMTNGAAAPSRMSNGNVAGATGSSLDVQYKGGAQHVTVPPNTPVTEIKATSKTLAAGDQVVVLAKRGADGSLSTTAALLVGK
jgi:hypothetical protein